MCLDVELAPKSLPRRRIVIGGPTYEAVFTEIILIQTVLVSIRSLDEFDV